MITELTHLDLVEKLRANDELNRRFAESPILSYKPCCRVHQNHLPQNVCPVNPCPDSKHAKFHVSDKRIRVVFGSNRSSKSHTGAAEAIMTSCLKTHPITKKKNPTACFGRIYAPDYGLIEKKYIPLIKSFIPKAALKEDGKTKEEAWENSYDSKYHVLYLKGGGMIDFMSYDQDTSKSEAVELDWVWADEEMPENQYAAALARLISKNGRLWLTVTPLYKITWAMRFLDSVDPQVEVFRFSIYDNPYISEKAIQEFEATVPEHEKEARMKGNFMELQGLVYKELNKDVHLLGEDQPKSMYPVIFVLDPHPRKASIGGWAYVTPKDDVVFFDEIEMKGTAREIASAIRQKEATHKAKTVLRIIDPAARAQGNNLAFETDTLREFEHEGMGFSLADNSDAGYNVVHDYLTYDPSKPLSSFNRPKCFFTKNVPKIWFSMTHLLWDEWAFRKSLKEDKEKIRDYQKDGADVVRYALARRPSYRSFLNTESVYLGNMETYQADLKRQNIRDFFNSMRKEVANA